MNKWNCCSKQIKLVKISKSDYFKLKLAENNEQKRGYENKIMSQMIKYCSLI